MTRFQCLVVFAVSALHCTLGEETCSDIDLLGTVGWERYDGSIDVMVDEDCMYTWTAVFKHDETLPVPTDPATQCDAFADPPAIAADGIPYFAFRWSYIDVPDYFEAATGINHLSLDFNPCGHPPIDVYTVPHYDLHTYRVTPEKRTCMLCTPLAPNSPVCDHTTPQTTDSGIAFFTPISADFPPGFVNFETDAVLRMGGHAWHPDQQPVNAASWTEPVLVMGSYNGTNIYYEPMAPLSFVTGNTTNFWEEDITYVDQTIENLATYTSVSYDADTGFTTMTFKGKSSVCKEEFDKLKNGGSTSGSNHWKGTATLMAGVILGVISVDL